MNACGLCGLAFALIVGGPVLAADNLSSSDRVTVPAGSFTMGQESGPQDERPAHQLSVGAFEIDRLPVTNIQFAEFLNGVGTHNPNSERLYDDDDPDARIHKQGNRWSADKGYENHPAVEVSWPGARDYWLWRGKRLPTEAEWEKAARGADGRKYPWGNTPADHKRAQFAVRFNDTAPANAFAATPRRRQRRED